jgi:hypothetical protein
LFFLTSVVSTVSCLFLSTGSSMSRFALRFKNSSKKFSGDMFLAYVSLFLTSGIYDVLFFRFSFASGLTSFMTIFEFTVSFEILHGFKEGSLLGIGIDFLSSEGEASSFSGLVCLGCYLFCDLASAILLLIVQ